MFAESSYIKQNTIKEVALDYLVNLKINEAGFSLSRDLRFKLKS